MEGSWLAPEHGGRPRSGGAAPNASGVPRSLQRRIPAFGSCRAMTYVRCTDVRERTVGDSERSCTLRQATVSYSSASADDVVLCRKGEFRDASRGGQPNDGRCSRSLAVRPRGERVGPRGARAALVGVAPAPPGSMIFPSRTPARTLPRGPKPASRRMRPFPSPGRPSPAASARSSAWLRPCFRHHTKFP